VVSGFWYTNPECVVAFRRKAGCQFQKKMKSSPFLTSMPGVLCIGKAIMQEVGQLTFNKKLLTGFHSPS